MDAVTKLKKLFVTFIFISFALILFRPFIVNQIATRGDGYLGYNMFYDAIRQYKKALLLDRQNSEIMNWLGYAYKSIGDKDKAVDMHEKAIKIDPQNITAYYDLGMIYITEKKYKLARECFLKVGVIPHDNKKITEDEHSFYHRTALKMLSHCQEKLGERRRDKYEE